MRLFLFLAIACFIISLVCLGVPTTFIGLSGLFWAVAALLSCLLDERLGSIRMPPNPPQ